MPIALLSIDPALGRLDYYSLSDQALMETLIEDMNEDIKKELQDANGNYLDVCDWDAQTSAAHICCEDDRVIDIDIRCVEFDDNQFPFDCIPSQVYGLVVESCFIHGTLDTAYLPQTLQHLNVSINDLDGTINFKRLPQSLEHLDIRENDLSGSLALSDLPKTLKEFFANRNRFSGDISLNDLPPALDCLFIYGNSLTGSIKIEKLPEALESLHLNENSFSGDFRLLTFPESLRTVDVSKNPLSGKCVLLKAIGEMPFMRLLRLDKISSVVDENGDKHAWHDALVTM